MGSVHHSIQILKLNNSEINLLSVKLQILIYDPQYIESFKKFLEVSECKGHDSVVKIRTRGQKHF